MKLDERKWISGAGVTAEWKWVGRRRIQQALEGLKAAEKGLRDSTGARYLLRTKGTERDRILSHPAFDYWLFLWDKHFAGPLRSGRASDWDLQAGQLQGFAAALAASRGETLELAATLDPDGRFHLFGSPRYFEFPGAGTAPVRVRVRRGTVSVSGPRGRAAAEGELEQAVPGIVVDDRGWLMTHGVTMHGLARLEPSERARFAEVLRAALSDMAERDPGLHAELLDLVRALIPLKNPMNHGSVSSSYANLRGAIGLSHAEDPLLQAETLIHEFCHQKMNQLLAADPVLLPGQAGQVFYSPWRDDARRLRGLLLGAHAFLNVARYLARSLAREDRDDDARIELMVNVARRARQIELALRSLSAYGSFTEFGRRFLLGLWGEFGRLQHATLWFPPALVAEQDAVCEEHRRRFALYGTGFHRGSDFVDNVRRVAFLTPVEPAETKI